jgi:hypothetical protein
MNPTVSGKKIEPLFTVSSPHTDFSVVQLDKVSRGFFELRLRYDTEMSNYALFLASEPFKVPPP